MFSILVHLQIVAIVCSICISVLLLRLQGSVENKFLFMSTLCVDIYSIGYLQEMMSRSADGMRVALSFEYTGLCFAALSYSMFIFGYCHVKKIPRFVIHILMAFCLFVLVNVCLGTKSTLYYKSLIVSGSGWFLHAKTEKGPLYWMFAIYQAVLMIVDCTAIYMARRRLTRASEKRQYLILLIEGSLPIIGLFTTVFIDLRGWDPSPLLLTILVSSITITIKRGHFVDVINLAKEDMFQNVGTAVIITDPLKYYVDSNRTANELFPILSTVDPGASLGTLTNAFFGDDEERIICINNRYYQSSYTELMEKERLAGYVVSVSDVTEMREQMEEMRMLKEKADAASVAKSAFLANMSHEIRTPLNAIIGMSELSESEKSENVIREYISQIKSAGKVLLGIVNDVLDFSKAESGRLELVNVEFETTEFFNSIINISMMRIGSKPVDFVVDFDPNIPSKLYGDDVHIRQIFMNILSNADKFTASGHILWTIDAKRDGDRVHLMCSIEDTGLGIKDEDKEKLFNAFQQIDTKKNRKIQGSGLGLAIFAQLVRLMNGSYSLESEYGKGSRFIFDIEVGVVDDKPFANASREKIVVKKGENFLLYGAGRTPQQIIGQKAKMELPDYSAKKVLVVDDNKVNVKVLAAFLKQYKIVADSAFSGPESIEMIKNKQYDIIFMDHMMPEMDGVEATEIIRKMDGDYYKKVPIIACTANVIKGVEDTFREAGMNGFVPKPIQMDVLSEILNKYLDE